MLQPDAGDHHGANRPIEQKVRQHCRTVGPIAEQRKINQRRLAFAHAVADKYRPRRQRPGQHGQRQRAAPAPAVALADKQIHQHQRNNQAQQTADVQLMLAGAGAAALRRAAQQKQRQQGNGDREDEDPAPAQSGGDSPANEGTETAAAPRADDPEADRPLPRTPFIPGLNQRQRRRHNAGRRQPLQHPAGQEQPRSLSDHQHGAADDTQPQPEGGHPHPAKLVRQAAAGDHEAAAEQRAETDGQS